MTKRKSYEYGTFNRRDAFVVKRNGELLRTMRGAINKRARMLAYGILRERGRLQVQR